MTKIAEPSLILNYNLVRKMNKTIMNSMRDNARQTYINQSNGIENWNVLKEHLSKRYQKSNLLLRKKLNDLKQTASVQDYIFEFEKITNQLKSEIQEKEKMYH